MPKWAKALLLLVAVAGVGLCAGSALLHRLFSQKVQEMETAGSEGGAWGASHTLAECVDEVARRSGACADVDVTCLPTVAGFAWGCFEAAPYDASVCDGVPVPTRETNAQAWALKECAARGMADDNSCAFGMMTVLSFCYNRSER